MLGILFSSTIAFALTLFAAIFFAPIAKHLGLVDIPGGRKQHKENIPLIGGIAIFFGFFFALLTLPFSLSPYRTILAGAGLLLVAGILDDLHELKPHYKLVAQVLAAIFPVIFGHYYFINYELLYPHLPLTINLFFSNFFSLIILVACINAFNMLDGLDGLLATFSFFVLAGLAVMVGKLGQIDLLALIALVLAALFAFALKNLPFKKIRAKVFLGDAGSMLLGYLASAFILVFKTQLSSVQLLHAGFVLWLLALPIFDSINVTLFRWRQSYPLMQASRHHIHHYLEAKGYSSTKTLLILSILGFLTSCISVLAYFVVLPSLFIFYGFFALFFVVTFVYQWDCQRVFCIHK